MTCRDFDEIVHGLVRLELLDVGLREEALEHAARCSQCEERMAQARMLAEATELAANCAPEHRASPRVEAVLLTAFRNRRRRTTWWRTLEWATATAAAVALAGFFWIAPYRAKLPTAPTPGRGVSSQPRGPQYASGPDLSSPDSQD
jgi:anti-sigma factor RsiW